MANEIGVMQGRLLPKYRGRYQAHPVGYWQDEFAVAKESGLDCIEFILDFNDAEINPLLKDGGVEEILSVSDGAGVSVKTICADYFMEAPLHHSDAATADHSLTILERLLDSANKIGVTDLVIPCVDQSSLGGEDAVDRFVKQVCKVEGLIEAKGVNLSLETDLAPASFADLLARFDSRRITVNYDIGNSAALGFDPVEELEAYGHRISDIHIKDRVLGGGPVMLGEGDADFDLFFSELRKYDYRGPFIMQAYRDDEGVAIFRQQLEWIKPYLEVLHG